MRRLHAVLLVAIFSLPVFDGCGGSKPTPPPKQYQLKGVVVKLDPQVRTATIKHERIDGWMEAMTMEFPVREAKEFDKLAVGKHITATVYVTDDVYWIGNIQPAS